MNRQILRTMQGNLKTSVATACLVVGSFSLASATITVPNNSFETYAGGQGFTAPFGGTTVSSWTFGPSVGGVGYDGISINEAVMTPAPDGSVAAFIEKQGTISQLLSGFSGRGSTVSFYAESSGLTGSFPLQVLMDSTVLTFNSATTLTPGSTTSWTQYTTDLFAVSAGSHTLTFNNAGSLDRIDFLDLITVNEIPEPSTLFLLVLGAGLVRRQVRRRRMA